MRYGALVTAGMLVATLGVAPVRVSIDDRPLAATTIVRHARVLLPFRLIFSALHASVSYDARTHLISARRGSDRVALRTGEHESILLAEHLYVPVRYVSEALGARVQYDAPDRIVFISDLHSLASVPQTMPDAPDAPATPPPGYQPPVPYATDNGYAVYTQAMNFYIPSDRYTYYPGDRLELILNAPPGGTAYIDMCGFEQIQFNNPPGSTQYFLNFFVPKRLSGRSCGVTAYYYGALGARQTIALPYALQFPATPSPTQSPSPTPSPAPTATPRSVHLQPVRRIPQSKATPKPTDSPSPTDSPAPTIPPMPTALPPIPHIKFTPRPRPTPPQG